MNLGEELGSRNMSLEVGVEYVPPEATCPAEFRQWQLTTTGPDFLGSGPCLNGDMM